MNQKYFTFLQYFFFLLKMNFRPDNLLPFALRWMISKVCSHNEFRCRDQHYCVHQVWQSTTMKKCNFTKKKYTRHGFVMVIKTAQTEQTKMSQGGFVETKKNKRKVIDYWPLVGVEQSCNANQINLHAPMQNSEFLSRSLVDDLFWRLILGMRSKLKLIVNLFPLWLWIFHLGVFQPLPSVQVIQSAPTIATRLPVVGFCHSLDSHFKR